ncbi:MAG: serine/threonine protein kinase [Myxococcales bacterium]|nr:serine/threonine protein kinase [Myxococcales bacterium]
MDDGPDGTEQATIDGRPTAAEGEGPSARESVRRVSTERYKVINRLGKGGMGEVMAVRDANIGREVALKRIRKADPSERVIDRFMREASIQGRLEHPAIVPLYDLGRDPSGQPFFTMKKLTGTTLSKLLGSDRPEVTQQRLLRAFAEVCLAVEFAHVRGIVHRDLKPDNIVLGDFGEVYVLDWGVAKVIGEADEFADVASGSSEDNEALATLPGMQVGTPGYMAPEQVRGDVDLDARADIYALGCILFEILTRTMLHPTGKLGLASALSGVDAKASERAPGRGIPPELDELCVASTHLDRERRLQTARELGDRVQRYLDGDRDLAARQLLARDHLTTAQAAFDVAGDAQRSLAMREAGMALALDPTLTAAAELVGRLMLEPPQTTPPEVEAAILADDVKTMQGNARVGIYAYVAFFAFMPMVWWIAPQGSPWVLAISLLILLNLGICYWGSRVNPIGKEGIIAVTNAILLAIVARMYTPFLIAPGLAAMSAMAIMFTPTRSKLTSIAGMVGLPAVAVLGPWLLERFDLLSITTTVDHRGILMNAVAIAGDETSTLTVAALYVLGLIAAAAGMASRMHTRERTAKRRLHLQAWQLRQLVQR